MSSIQSSFVLITLKVSIIIIKSQSITSPVLRLIEFIYKRNRNASHFFILTTTALLARLTVRQDKQVYNPVNFSVDSTYSHQLALLAFLAFLSTRATSHTRQPDLRDTKQQQQQASALNADRVAALVESISHCNEIDLADKILENFKEPATASTL
jgi:hypothetical protein